MKRFNFLIGALLFSTLIFSGCRTNKEDEAVSPTVTPGDPNAIQGASGSNTPAAPSGVQRTYSGLQYQVLKQGSGKRPSTFNKAKVHYHGTLLNGTVFDSSVQRGEPFTFSLGGGVIPGWIEGVLLMQEGAKYRFTIPPKLAYGARGAPPKIGPNETLIFEIELLEILY